MQRYAINSTNCIARSKRDSINYSKKILANVGTNYNEGVACAVSSRGKHKVVSFIDDTHVYEVILSPELLNQINNF